MKKLVLCAALAGLGYFGWQMFQDWQRDVVVEGMAAEARAKAVQDAHEANVEHVGRVIHEQYGR